MSKRTWNVHAVRESMRVTDYGDGKLFFHIESEIMDRALSYCLDRQQAYELWVFLGKVVDHGYALRSEDV